jgi:plasmid stabilization system protein ParE
MDAIDSCTREDQVQAAKRYTELAFARTGQNLSPPVMGVFREMAHAKLRAAHRRLHVQDRHRADPGAKAA